MPMTKLVMRLFGGFHVEFDGEAIYGFESDKGRARPAYLSVEPDRPHRRESVASLLWPTALTSLPGKTSARPLSPAAGPGDDELPHFLFVTPTDVQFNTASDYTLYVADLEAFSARPPGIACFCPNRSAPISWPAPGAR